MNIGTLIETRGDTPIIAIAADRTVRDAIQLLAEERIGAVPVMESGRIAGIFSERDVIYCLAEEGQTCLDRAVGEVMTSPAITVTREASVDQALALMTKRRIRHLPVVDGPTMRGFVSIGDLVKSRMDEVKHEADAMRTYIANA